MSFTVKAQQGGATANGMALVVKVVTGASGTQPGAVNGIQSATPNLSITPNNTGSWVYGAMLMTGTYTVESGNTTQQNVTSGTTHFVNLRTTSTQTSGTPILMGSSTGSGIGISLAEIIPATSLTEDASSPAAVGGTGVTSLTTAAFTPPPGALLVASVSTNGGAGTTTMTMTDTSGLNLTWIEQQKENGGSHGYQGVWTAQLPGVASSPRLVIPRRLLARAVISLSMLPAVNATAAPVAGQVQPAATVAMRRRTPARAVILFRPVKTTNASGTNGTVQPRPTVPVPRRALARVQWSTNVIVRTANGAPVAGAGGSDDFFRRARTKRMYS